MWNFIKKVIEFFTGNLQITAFSNNKKIEKKVSESFVSGHVQQAEIINNTYNNLPDNKEKPIVMTEEQIEEEKRLDEDERLRTGENRRNYPNNNNYG
ncbi:MAG: hypothetical protein V1732_00560 [Patescibacteria group bacterium]